MQSRTLFFLAAIFCIALLGTASTHAASLTATLAPDSGVQTDTSDYAPGDSVIITGSGYWPNEPVSVEITNVYNPGLGDSDGPWTVYANGSGSFETYWIVPNEAVDQTFLLTARGVNSGIVATTTFTDANTRMYFALDIPDTICSGGELDVCGYLVQPCGGQAEAPLPGRMVTFWLRPGNCGTSGGTPIDSAVTDSNGLACATIQIPNVTGAYTIRIKFDGESQPTPPAPANSACDPGQYVNLSASNECEPVTIVANAGTAATVTLPNDTTRFLCGPGQICLPVSISDPDCDVDTVYSNIGQYGGTRTNFDQVQKVRQIGGTVTQVGGGFPGKALHTSADFVAPVSATSGVTVTLPNFIFASTVSSYGTFSNVASNVQYGGQLLGAPTDMTYTLVGAGGPDGGNGDGSLDFAVNSNITVNLASMVEACNGSSTDLVLFTDAGAGGTAQVLLKRDGVNVYTTNVSIPSATNGGGTGGVTLDLADGIRFNQVYVKGLTGSFKLDAVAARIAPSSTQTDICFQADTAGTYRIIVTAIDCCHHSDADTAYVTVTMNHAPVANAGADFSRFQCMLSQICFPVTFSDTDNNIMLKELISGPGTLSSNQICYTPAVGGTSTFIIKVTDSCGATDFDTVNVTVTANSAPVATNPSPITTSLCGSSQLCYNFMATDVNGGPLTWALLSGPGTITAGGQYCFTPGGTGTYNATVTVTDSCGLKDTTSIQYNVTINAAPVATDPTSPVNVFQCVASQICYQFLATDPNSNPLTWTKLSGSGTVSSSGQWCFTPTTAGSYSVLVRVADSCGLADTTSLTYNVTLNGAPTIAFGNDTSVSLCTPTQVCVPYTVSDPQGLAKLTESMVSGFGAIDTVNNRVCFTPNAGGIYTFIVNVSDSCGATDRDTVNVTVTFGAVAEITCPAGPIPVSLCAPGQVCQMLTISPASATVTTSMGTYSGGQLCFTANTAGTYNIRVIATAPCGADTCDLTFNVAIGQAAQITCPPAQNTFLCAPGQVCVPVGVMGAGATVSVTPIGSYSGGNVCFQADTSGHYVLTVIASTSCGSDTCQVISNVTLNSPPVATNPVSPKDTFVCASANICYQFAATDVNGGTMTWSRLSGAGTVSASGQWCFTAATSGVYTVTAKVADSCGAADTVTMTYNVTINSAPNLALGNDTSIFLCGPSQVCLPYTATDVNTNISSISLITGTGMITLAPAQLCFMPAASGPYTFVAEVVDACGATDRDTIVVNVQLNRVPTVYAGADQTIFQCAAAQICWPVTSGDPDGNLSTVQLITGPGTYAAGQICFTPTGTLNYEFVLKATDACGAVAYDTVVIYYTLNSAPTISLGPDQNLFQCNPAQICVPFTANDVNGNLTGVSVVSGPGSVSGNSVCFTPVASGLYTIIAQATDACGAYKRDTVNITVTINSAPVCSVPNDTTIFQCAATQVCLPVGATDVNGNLTGCQIISGPGAIIGGNWCYTPPSSQLVTVTIQCTDACGATCTSDFTVEFKINQAPTITWANYSQFFQCSPTQICLNYTVSDPNDPRPRTVTLVSGSGTLDTTNHRICFTPIATGIYRFIVQVTDECGLTAKDTIDADVRINSAPVANAGPNQTLFQCAPTQICWPVSCSDVDMNLANCIFSGPGTYSGGQICFTPPGSGSYLFTLTAVDACGLQHVDSVTISVTINSAPTLAFGNDTTLFLCTPQQVCMGYTVSDPNGMNKLTEVMVSGFGTLDTLNNKVCFTPNSSGTYEFIVSVTDSCGATDRDTIRANVTFGQFANITCPAAPISKFLCAPGQICEPLAITPVGATVTASFGSYSAGNLCFQADTTGTYVIRVIASSSCGADTCFVTFNVTLNTPPVASAGPDQSVFQCAPTQICWPASCSDVNGNLDSCKLVSGPGTYNGSGICFTPTGTGVYTFVLRAVDACGAAKQDTVNINVTINSAPTLAFGNDTTLFLCTPQQVCMSYSVSDPNGMGKLTEVLVAGFGTLDSANNKVCFTPNATGVYEFIVSVTDSCGASDLDTVRANINFGTFAEITCPPSPINASLCGAGQVCQGLTIMPVGATVTTSFGTFSGGQLCFQADTTGTYNIRVIANSSCGADTCNLTFNVYIGQAAQLNCPGPQTRFLCTAGNVAVPIGVMGDGAVVNVTPIGSYAAGNVNFTADTTGHYVLNVIASTTCGADTCQVVVDVTINSAPLITSPNTPMLSVDTFLCASANICRQFAASDVNGGTLTWAKLSGVGTISATGQWCFTAGAAGVYTVAATVADSCGAKDTVTVTYNVGFNVPPVIAFGNDTTISLCPGGSTCVSYTVSDANNNLTLEELISGPGTINTTANTVCFFPASSGTYTFIVKATDACGAFDTDTINVTINIGQVPVVTCPPSESRFLCSAGQICRPVTITPGSASVTVSPIGTFSGGNVCFNADTSGHYVIKVKASNVCGADSCYVIVDVTLNSKPVAVDPVSPVDTFICGTTQICYQFAATDVNGGTLTWSRLSGNGTVTPTGQWCFTAASAGNYSVAAVVTDSCGGADTLNMTYVITMNGAPVVTLGNDTTRFLCSSNQVCFGYAVSDPNANVVSEELITAVGTIDTAQNRICFTPASGGTYQFVVKVTDGCGAFDYDTINVTIQLNNAPVANAGPDATHFLCSSTQLCWPASASDPDNNLDSIKVVSAVGSYASGQICFTPNVSGSYVIVLRAVDKCGLAVQDTVIINVTINTPPVCDIPNDTTYFQCVPTQVSRPISATDINGNFDHCELVSGPGSIVNGNWVYTPSGDEVRKVVVQCLDSCGVACVDSFRVTFLINAAPVVNSGKDTTYFICNNTTICWDVVATDEDNNLSTVELISPFGTYNPSTKKICADIVYTDQPNGSYTFVVKATDACGAVDYDTTVITVDFNNKPVVAGPPDFTAYMEQVGPFCFDIDISDPDHNLSTVTVAPFGTYDPQTEQVCFNVVSKGTYCVYVTATDGCGLQMVDTVCIEVQVDECIHVQIEKTHGTLQGQREQVNLFMNGSGKQLGGFDFLVSFDPTVLSLMSVMPGPLFAQCGWEYFNYHIVGSCDGCPDGLLEIVGIAETNNGAYHPGCFLDGMVGSLAVMEFLVNNDRTLECQYAPINFFWTNCTDNTLSSKLGDTLWISRRVKNFELVQIQDYTAPLPSMFGAPNSCLTNPGEGKPAPQRCVDFTNGGVDVICADSIDARGDINLNNVAYEISDAVLYANYFIYGMSVFTINRDGQIAASDVNADGLVLSVADLVYLIRVITGEAPPTPKLNPNENYEAELSFSGGMLTMKTTDTPIGALYATFDGKVVPSLHEQVTDMELKYSYDGAVTKVLVYSSSGKGQIVAGPVLYVRKAESVKSVELGSSDGYVVTAKVNTLPSEYSLSQNYPNPFNPRTVIEFALPMAGQWKLTIYNVLGQSVQDWEGRDEAGFYKIEWDARSYASGVYFYRLTAGTYSATRKMVLLK